MSSKRWTAEDAEALRAAVGRFVRAGRMADSLPAPQALVLGYLDREGAMTITQLAERAEVRHQSMRKTVAILERDGLLSTEKSATDARKVICSITDEGRRRLRLDRDGRVEWILSAVQNRLSAAQRADALGIAGLLELLAGDRDAGDDGPVVAAQ